MGSEAGAGTGGQGQDPRPGSAPTRRAATRRSPCTAGAGETWHPWGPREPSWAGGPKGKAKGSRALLAVPPAQGPGTGGWLSSGAGQGDGEDTGHVSPGVRGSPGPACLQGSHLQDHAAQHPGGGMAPGTTTPQSPLSQGPASHAPVCFCSGETQSQAPPETHCPRVQKAQGSPR